MQLFVSCPLVTQVGQYYNGVIALEVDSSDTVEEVKSMIHERGGLSPEKQLLSFVGETLEDDRKLSSYKIGSNCLLEETSMWIAVRIQSSKSILLSVDRKETVGSIKAMIKEKGGVPSSQETILYGNNEKLENLKTLEESRIVNRSRLYLRIPAGQSSTVGSVELYVQKELEDPTITLQVELSNSVEDLKYLIYEKENIVPDQQELFYEGVPLVNRRTLSSYNILHQSIIIFRKLLTFVTICTQTGERLELEVSPNEFIYTIKAKIQDLKGVSPDKQKLSFEGKELLDMLTLSVYAITQEGAKLDLTTYQRGNISVTIISTMICEGFKLSIHQETSVYTLKQLISRTIGVLFGSQFLLCDGRVLENNKTLEDYGISDGSVLELLEQPVKIYKIYVFESNVTEFEVSSTSPVLILNEIYREKNLIFKGKKLNPDHCLGDYNIQRGHLVHACTKYIYSTIELNLRTPSGEHLASFFVDRNESVLNLKVRIWSDVPNMPPPSQQRLTHNDSPMEDCQTLGEFRLKKSDLVVVSTPQQVFVRCSNGTAITIGVHITDLVFVLKRLIYKMTGTEPDKQLLYFNGIVMDDDCTIKRYNIGTDSLLQLCKLVYGWNVAQSLKYIFLFHMQVNPSVSMIFNERECPLKGGRSSGSSTGWRSQFLQGSFRKELLC